MNKRCRALSREEFEKLVKTIEYGYEYEGVKVRPNHRLAVFCITQYSTLLRMGDVLMLRLCDIKYESGRYHFSIYEEKTKKYRNFIINPAIYTFLQTYALENDIKPNQPLFPIGKRAVSKQLNRVGKYLGYDDFGSHSFRKTGSMEIYEKYKDPVLIKELLQHSSVTTSMAYLQINPDRVEKALMQLGNIPEL